MKSTGIIRKVDELGRIVLPGIGLLQHVCCQNPHGGGGIAQTQEIGTDIAADIPG